MNIIDKIRLYRQLSSLSTLIKELPMTNDTKTTIGAIVAALGIILSQTTGINIDADVFDLLKTLPFFQNGLSLSSVLTSIGLIVWGWYTRGKKKVEPVK